MIPIAQGGVRAFQFNQSKAPYYFIALAFLAVSLVACVPASARAAAMPPAPAGKRGPHTLRHARAISLLRASVPIKAIGDLLGHTVPAATAMYLKLATDDLRDVCLDIPMTGENMP